MRSFVLALVLSLGGGAAYACDCQKKQAEKQCDCPGQSCPGECPGMDKNKAEKPKPDKKKQS